MDLWSFIHTIHDFPKPWVSFKDIWPLLASPSAFSFVVSALAKECTDADIIVWLDARGFVFGAAVALQMQKPFVMIRKKWKLPWLVIEQSYDLEYGSNTLTIQTKPFPAWSKVAIIDDVLATWWTALAACQLIEKSWWIVQWCHFVMTIEVLAWFHMIKKYSHTSILWV